MDGKQFLKQHFQIEAERANRNDYQSNGFLYSIVDVTNKEQEYLVDLHQMAQYLQAQGDRNVSVFVRSIHETYLITENKQDFVVLKSKVQTVRKPITGYKLAKFHQRGHALPFTVKKASQFGQWRQLWSQQLDGVEQNIEKILQRGVDDEFGHLLIDSFPYYLGLSENALQYLADTEVDETPQSSDFGTICHASLHQSLWERQGRHDPFDWLFDHPSRDVSEWIRTSYFKGTLFYRANLTNFINEYQQVIPLTPFSWRLIYARLLFPTHYFQCLNSYLSSQPFQEKKEKEEQLKKYMRNTSDYEQFLGTFYDVIGVPTTQWKIPIINWLK